MVLFALMSLLAISQTTMAYKPDIYPVEEAFGRFIIEAEYDRGQAYVGNDNLRLVVTITTTGNTNLILDKCESPDESKIKIELLNPNAHGLKDGAVLKTTYLFRVDIRAESEGKEGAHPRIYPLQLSLHYPTDPTIIKRPFGLNVGVRNNGLVKALSEDTDSPEFLTGKPGMYTVELVNNFPNYPVNIRQIEIKSDPPGLIEKNTIPMDLRIEPLQRRSFDVPFNVKSMSYKNLLTGFGEATYLTLVISYDDSNDRVITDLTQKVRIKVRPSGRVLFISMLIGVIVGTVLKWVLQHLQQRGIISKKDAIWYASTTVFIGLVVSVIALVGKVKVVFFDATGSYDIPAVIFVIGLIAAVLGSQLLSTWFRTPTTDQPPQSGCL
jgi:hypothetical protein